MCLTRPEGTVNRTVITVITIIVITVEIRYSGTPMYTKPSHSGAKMATPVCGARTPAHT
jgi:hypothetical protein